MSLIQDIRFAARVLFKDGWFTAMAAVVLALGIGANNAVFTIVNAVLLRSLPFEKSDQLMMVLSRDSRGRDSGISLLDYRDWRSATRTFSHLSFVFSGSFNIGEEGKTRRCTREASCPPSFSGCWAYRRSWGAISPPRRICPVPSR